MDIEEATKVVGKYAGFLEFAHRRFWTIFFCSGIPESLLPYPIQHIEDALNVEAKSYHDQGEFEKVKLLQECHGWLGGFKDDEESMLQVVKNFNDKKIRNLLIELVVDFRNSADQKNYISAQFKDIPIEEVDFKNPDFPTAYIMMTIYFGFLQCAHLGLGFIFCQKIPQSLLPFPKEILIKALDVCSIVADDENRRAYNSGKSMLDEYVSDEIALSEMIDNFSNKEIRDSIISDIKNFQLQSAKS